MANGVCGGGRKRLFYIMADRKQRTRHGPGTLSVMCFLKQGPPPEIYITSPNNMKSWRSRVKHRILGLGVETHKIENHCCRPTLQGPSHQQSQCFIRPKTLTVTSTKSKTSYILPTYNSKSKNSIIVQNRVSFQKGKNCNIKQAHKM